MKMKYTMKLMTGLMVVVGMLVALPVAAQAKLAVFDAQQVINDTNAAKRAVQTLTSKRDAAQGKINLLEKPLVDKQMKLKEQQAVLAPDKFRQLQADFAKDLAKFRTDAQAIQADLDEDNLKIRKQIAESVRGVVEQIAKEKGFDAVLPKGMLFYTSDKVPDISVEVLSRANKALDK